MIRKLIRNARIITKNYNHTNYTDIILKTFTFLQLYHDPSPMTGKAKKIVESCKSY